MTLADGIRRNVATISQEERDSLRDAFLQLDTTKFYPDGVSYWDKQEQIEKYTSGQDGPGFRYGPVFLPWHRELCNRFEALLREVDPQLSLHYWDWTTDPRATPDGAGSTVNLFTPRFMGSDGSDGINRISGDGGGDAGPPFQNFESTEGAETRNGHDHIWCNVNRGIPGAPGLAPDHEIVTTGDDASNDQQFPLIRRALEHAYNIARDYIGGSMSQEHFSFHDPFVFLLLSNVDRLWAKWQMAPGKAWRMDPHLIYGKEGDFPLINANLEPWSGGMGLRPWAPPDNQQVVTSPKDLSLLTPPRYDTLERN